MPFLSSTGPQLDQLRAALAAQDALIAEQVAHRLRGAAANLGADALAAACAELEQQAATAALALARRCAWVEQELGRAAPSCGSCSRRAGEDPGGRRRRRLADGRRGHRAQPGHECVTACDGDEAGA
jgi:hypothetical protein